MEEAHLRVEARHKAARSRKRGCFPVLTISFMKATQALLSGMGFG